MTPEDERAINVTLDALGRLMSLYQAERWVYLIGAIIGLGLALWAVTLMGCFSGHPVFWQ
jgi:hypothetical protein